MIMKIPIALFVVVPVLPDSGSMSDPGFGYTLAALMALGFIAVKLIFRKS